MQTTGVSYTPLQLGGVSALTCTIAVIGMSLRQSTFSLLILKKMFDIPALRPDLRPIQTTLGPNQITLCRIQIITSVIPVWSDKLVKLPCNKS